MPFGGNLHTNKPLTNVAVDYKNAEYIADQVLTNIPVKKESDLYYTFVRDFRIPETLRANGSPSNRISWAVSTTAYALQEHALKDVITDRDRGNADDIDVDVKTTETLTDKILLRKEFDAATQLFTTGSWGNNASATTATSWAYNTTTSNPIGNVQSASTVILKNSGRRPNKMIMGSDVFDALKGNTNVFNRVQYVERAIVTAELLASLFDLDKVFVGNAVYDAGLEGVAESITSVWGPNALLAYISNNPGMKELTAAGMLEIKGKYNTKKWRDEEVGGDWIEVSSMFVPKLIATSCGYYFSNYAIQ